MAATRPRQQALLAAPCLDRVFYQGSRLLYLILDGALIPIERVADQRPYYSGKHNRHGVNIQVLADARGQLQRAAPTLPGAIHDVKAARTHGIPDDRTPRENGPQRNTHPQHREIRKSSESAP